MNAEEFAGFEQILGQRIIRANGVHWRQVRPFFFRPLLPYEELATISVRPPRQAAWGGCQYAVAGGEKGNSFLNLRMFDNSGGYSSESLDYNRKRQVRLAAKQFSIRPVTDLNEFKEKAHPVYLSFYERTRYPFATERRDKGFFSWWAGQLFQNPRVMILGGYRKDELEGISLPLLVGDTLYYAMFFCNTESMRLYLADLMLHSVREMAGGCPEVKQIFAGMYKGGGGHDDFYLLRGCNIVHKPAMLCLNPLVKIVLRAFFAREHARLLGRLEGGARNHAALDSSGKEAGNHECASEKPC